MLHSTIDRSDAQIFPVYAEDDPEELGRIANELSRLSRALANLTVGRSKASNGATTVDSTLGMPSAAAIRTIIRHRRTRENFFNATLFGDPAWDILLDLLVAHLEEQKVSVSSLTIAAAVPATTALRWITSMTQEGLLCRQPDPFDGRRVNVALSENALTALKGYFGKIASAPCPVL